MLTPTGEDIISHVEGKQISLPLMFFFSRKKIWTASDSSGQILSREVELGRMDVMLSYFFQCIAPLMSRSHKSSSVLNFW